MREKPCEFVQILQHQFTQTVEHMRAVANGPLSPIARSSGARLDGSVNIIGATHLDLRDDFSKAWIDDVLNHLA